MSVIIRNMPMPANCIECDFLQAAQLSGWLECKRTGKQTYNMNRAGMDALFIGRDKNCPLFEAKSMDQT